MPEGPMFTRVSSLPRLQPACRLRAGAGAFIFLGNTMRVAVVTVFSGLFLILKGRAQYGANLFLGNIKAPKIHEIIAFKSLTIVNV
jgi:hypothetical protein